MDYDIKYKDFRADVRAHCEEKIAPHAAEVDREQKFSDEIRKVINDRGWWGCRLSSYLIRPLTKTHHHARDNRPET